MTTKGKKKQTRKQRIASMKNLAKAQKALRAKGKTKTKTTRKASRSTSKPKHKKTAAKKKTAMTKSKSRKPTKAKRPAMRAAPKVPRGVRPAGRSKPRRPAGSKQTPAQHRASLRNLAKARAARKRASKRHPVKPHSYPVKSKNVHVPAHRSWESRERKHKQSPAQRRASLANLRKARAAQKRGHRGHGARETARASKGQTPAQRRASLRNLAKARSARKKATQRHNVSSYSYNRKGGTRHVPGHLSWETAGYYENPFTGTEMFIAGFSGLVWFMLTDLVDRIVATHDLTDKGAKDAAGYELYADNPPTSGDYSGLFNPTAICAPMNGWRWAAGGLMVGAPLLLTLIPEMHVKSAGQFMFFAAFLRVGGKAFIDLTAYALMRNPFGQRLYDGEMRAQVLASNDQTLLSSLPSAGLGNPGCQCENCTTGVGACQAGTGTGWPSNVREVAPSTSTSDGGAPPPPPMPPPQSLPNTEPGASEPGYLAGIAALPPRNPFAWGLRDEEKERAA